MNFYGRSVSFGFVYFSIASTRVTALLVLLAACQPFYYLKLNNVNSALNLVILWLTVYILRTIATCTLYDDYQDPIV